jgi:GNAT superfamily N-acetyltransferase
MSVDFTIRQATDADRAIIAHHRVAMCLDIGTATPAAASALEEATLAWLAHAMPSGEYLGWLATPVGHTAQVVAGAGVQLRRVLPFPQRHPDGRVDVAEGRQGIVVNVYTEPAFRRQGLARRLMETILTWARSVRLESLVLHASPDGKPLYDALGFVTTNEMRYAGSLTVEPPSQQSRTSPFPKVP